MTSCSVTAYVCDVCGRTTVNKEKKRSWNTNQQIPNLFRPNPPKSWRTYGTHTEKHFCSKKCEISHLDSEIRRMKATKERLK